MVRFEGVILERWSNKPVVGARVTVGRFSTTSGSSGRFIMDVPEGTYTISISKSGYSDVFESLNIFTNLSKTYIMTPTFKAL